MIKVMMTTMRTINARGVRLRHGSTMTVDEFKRKAEDGIVAPLGIDRCNSLVIGLKTKRDMIYLFLAAKIIFANILGWRKENLRCPKHT